MPRLPHLVPLAAAMLAASLAAACVPGLAPEAPAVPPAAASPAPHAEEAARTEAHDELASFMLGRRRWRLVAMGERPLLRGTRITLAFNPHSLDGDTGCRLFSAPHGIHRSRLHLHSVEIAGDGCEDPRYREQDEAFVAALSQVPEIEVSSDALSLRVASGQVLRFEEDHPLRYTSVQPGTPLVLDRRDYTLGPVPVTRRGAHGRVPRELRVVVTYTNGSAQPVLPAACGTSPRSIELEGGNGKLWSQAYTWRCERPRPCEAGAVAPGASRTDTLVFRDHAPSESFWLPGGPVPGIYRLVYRAFPQETGCGGSAVNAGGAMIVSYSRPFQVRMP